MKKNIFLQTKNVHLTRLIEMIFLEDVFILISTQAHYQNTQKIDLLIIEDYSSKQFVANLYNPSIDRNIPTIYISQKSLKELKKTAPQKNILKVVKAPLKNYLGFRNLVIKTLLQSPVCF